MIALISSSVILEYPALPAQVGQCLLAWTSSIGPLRNVSATKALASRAICFGLAALSMIDDFGTIPLLDGSPEAREILCD